MKLEDICVKISLFKLWKPQSRSSNMKIISMTMNTDYYVWINTNNNFDSAEVLRTEH